MIIYIDRRVIDNKKIVIRKIMNDNDIYILSKIVKYCDIDSFVNIICLNRYTISNKKYLFTFCDKEDIETYISNIFVRFVSTINAKNNCILLYITTNILVLNRHHIKDQYFYIIRRLHIDKCHQISKYNINYHLVYNIILPLLTNIKVDDTEDIFNISPYIF